jgi:hypothetical protein
VKTLETRLESLVPSTSSTVKIAVMSTAPQLIPRPNTVMVEGMSSPASFSADSR